MVFMTMILIVSILCTGVLRIAMVKQPESRSVVNEVKGYLCFDVFSHCCNQNNFESDDSELEEEWKKLEAQQTEVPDTERILVTKDGPVFTFEETCGPLHDKAISHIPKQVNSELDTSDLKAARTRSVMKEEKVNKDRLERKDTKDLVRKFEGGLVNHDSSNTRNTEASKSSALSKKQSKIQRVMAKEMSGFTSGFSSSSQDYIPYKFTSSDVRNRS